MAGGGGEDDGVAAAGGAGHGEVAGGEESGEAEAGHQAHGAADADAALLRLGEGGGGHRGGVGRLELYIFL